jgi:hypothetical protein
MAIFENNVRFPGGRNQRSSGIRDRFATRAGGGDRVPRAGRRWVRNAVTCRHSRYIMPAGRDSCRRGIPDGISMRSGHCPSTARSEILLILHHSAFRYTKHFMAERAEEDTASGLNISQPFFANIYFFQFRIAVRASGQYILVFRNSNFKCVHAKPPYSHFVGFRARSRCELTRDPTYCFSRPFGFSMLGAFRRGFDLYVYIGVQNPPLSVLQFLAQSSFRYNLQESDERIVYIF